MIKSPDVPRLYHQGRLVAGDLLAQLWELIFGSDKPEIRRPKEDDDGKEK